MPDVEFPIPVDVPVGKTGRVTRLAGEPTDTPGLVVTPGLMADGSGCRDGYVVRHATSGLYIPGTRLEGLEIEQARRAAKALGTLDIDWTAGKADVLRQIGKRDGQQAVRALVDSARIEPDDEDGDGDDDWDYDLDDPEVPPAPTVNAGEIAAVEVARGG